MVMDATQPQQPSPQSVGREFVRQYYTLLNKAPNHLHRFYNNNSSFIHGESTLVVGQKNIHNRIQQLNFHDCHAKISQVDAQATLGNGVVVQVTGELSNDGQPMRRFTQTFVLAAQSPKKYYVHNDIFRYQDMYSDEEIDGEARSENGDEHEQQQLQPPLQTIAASVNDQGATAAGEQQPQPMPSQVIAPAAGGVMAQQPSQPLYYSVPAAGGRPMTVLQPPPGVAAVPIPNAGYGNAASGVPPPQQQPVQPAAPGVAQLNGVVGHEEIISNMQAPNIAPQPSLANQTPSPVVPLQAAVAPVAVAPTSAVINAQTPVGVSTVPVANAVAATLPQNAAGAHLQNFQQSPIIQAHILQQPQQPQQQGPPPQQHPSTPSQQQAHSLPQQQSHPAPTSSVSSMTLVDVDDTVNSNSVATNTEQQPRHNTAANVVASGQTISSSTTVIEATPAPVVEDFKTINEQQQQEKYEAAKQQQQQQNETKTFANLFKSASSFANAAMQQQQQIQQQQQQQTVGASMYQNNSALTSNSYSQAGNSNAGSMPYSNRNSEAGGSLRQDNNNGQGGGPLPQRANTKSFNKDFEQRRTSNVQYCDNQQLFLGNIPPHASEEEIKALFSRFGNVFDLRILSKGSGKFPPTGRNPMNYGFITFSDPESVQNCLANCPLYFPDNDPDGQKLNVEEKKPKTRTNDMPPRQSLGGSGMNNNMNSGQRNMTSGGLSSRSMANSGNGGGSMMRGNSAVNNNNNSMSRGGSSGGGVGPRMGGAFNRNDNRTSNGGSGSQMRGSNNNSQTQGNSYSVRR